MKKLISLYVVILLTITIACGQSRTNNPDVNSRKIVTPEYSKVDFFKDQKKLFCWSGPFSGATNINRDIRYMPLMSYNDLSVGQCRIISYPKAGLSAWESIIKPIRAMEQQHQEVRKIAQDAQVQEKYDIYAFFVEAKNLIPFPDPGDPNAREPNFPCPVYVYKRDSDIWVLLKKIDIKDVNDFADLKFDMAVGDKK